MSDFLEDMTEDNSKENVQMKTGEITGDQHLFHSLPKEFQQWHTNNYLIEKEGEVDQNLITKSLLNAYSWKIIMNATAYGMYSFMLVVMAIVSEKFFESAILSFFHFFFFTGTAIYIAYQFYFFGIIRAQVIGPLTEKSMAVTSWLYYQTFLATFLSLMIMLVFIFLFSEAILELIFTLLVTVKYSSAGHMDMITSFFFNFGVGFHNVIAKIVFSSGPFFYNIYFLSFLLPSVILGMSFFVERSGYNKQRRDIIDSMSDYNLNSGFPIEKSQKVITTWRAQNGM